jgi:hypothetical protein
MAEGRLDVVLVRQPASVLDFSGNENLHVYDHECVVIPMEGEPRLYRIRDAGDEVSSGRKR